MNFTKIQSRELFFENDAIITQARAYFSIIKTRNYLSGRNSDDAVRLTRTLN